jgi:hypothetical protein
MANRLERVRKLEVARDKEEDIFEGFTTQQRLAFKIMLEAEVDRRLFGDPAGGEASDECLWQNRMSRETYDAALASIPQTWWGRFQAWCLSRRRRIEAGEIMSSPNPSRYRQRR